jgi:hypothetical protein
MLVFLAFFAPALCSTRRRRGRTARSAHALRPDAITTAPRAGRVKSAASWRRERSRTEPRAARSSRASMASTASTHLLTRPSTALSWSATDIKSSLRRAAALALRPSIRGGPAVWRQPSPHNLVFGESQDVGFDMSGSNHDAVMRIGGRLLGGGSILQSGTTARVCIGSPPPRIVRALNRHCRSAPNFALSLSLAWGCRDHGAWHSQAALSTTPCGNSPVVT